MTCLFRLVHRTPILLEGRLSFDPYPHGGYSMYVNIYIYNMLHQERLDSENGRR